MPKSRTKKRQIATENDRKPERSWEVWRNESTAKRIDGYWVTSPDEQKHRRNIADLVATEMHSPFSTILEVGCGTGLVYEALRDVVGPQMRYRGIDNAETMLKIAIKRYPEIDASIGDAFNLAFGDNEFDLVCAFEVFGHMPDCSKPIAELIRVAKMVAIFSVWLTLGDEQTKGADHYEYPEEMIREFINRAAGDQSDKITIRKVDIGHSRAFVIRKAV